MPNSLTRNASLKLAPLFIETLVKHYFDRFKNDANKSGIALRKEELLYDEAFSIVKDFLAAATKHTVEELQSFSNTRTPSPPWVHVVRFVIPMSCCNDAATDLIKAFGGEQVMKQTVGGTKWWQVRGIRGVQAEWITAKKDWQDLQRKSKEHRDSTPRRKSKRYSVNFRRSNFTDASEPSEDVSEDKTPQPGPSSPEDSGAYQPEMDEMRCILYSHGGGYYFGSVDQERYSIQRYARKIHGRVLAVNYRLAPQYPFPCAIHDLLAAYLFLIRPPEGAKHRPVPPSHVVIAGDSAGGGLSLALLQVIRDAGLPLPAGGYLISPWCDFTHSFPSIFTNTDTDVIPPTGLSIHKPSELWPPPPDEMSSRVHHGLRTTIREAFLPIPSHKRDDHKQKARSDPNLLRPPDTSAPSHGEAHEHPDSQHGQARTLPTKTGAMSIGSTASLPGPGSIADQTIFLRTEDGEDIEIAQQIQLYAPNGLLKHPLVSPALSYLGGLPPLLFIASDREVLRDEVIYAAHRAAHPERFPIRQEVKDMYPIFADLDGRMEPTPVHLQVYDDAAHVLPVIFSFTTPAKYCYRGIASFCKHVTNMTAPLSPGVPTFTYSPATMTPDNESEHGLAGLRSSSSAAVSFKSAPQTDDSPSKSQEPRRPKSAPLLSNPPRARRSVSSGISEAVASVRRRSSLFVKPAASGEATPTTATGSRATTPASDPGAKKEGSGDVGGPRFGEEMEHPKGEVLAGDAIVYDETWARTPLHQEMIRERVSTHGVIRPLEDESELPALHVPPDVIGTLSERAIRRYLTGKEKSDKKYSMTIKHIAKHRQRNLERAKQDMFHHISQLQHYLDRSQEAEAESQAGAGNASTLREGLLMGTPTWSLAWALDGDERPPPSSIVARRDTEEAIKLARVADQAILAPEGHLNANTLWSVVVNFLTAAPEREEKEKQTRSGGKVHVAGGDKRKGKSSRFVAFWKTRFHRSRGKEKQAANGQS
ncbi:alpha/beta-hydrolase [Auriscalpium vulgare]|uniref:Alpha/beta-hydrolase n=1 Tax=Auriscalpium vulgare TaxID=40419 RepID=A0ACB8S4E8_9AGAM|nr:alpha/beta-hydrolase [Auriscalpium vulgare]